MIVKKDRMYNVKRISEQIGAECKIIMIVLEFCLVCF